MRANEKIGKRGLWSCRSVLFTSIFQIDRISLSATEACGGGKIENDDTKSFKTPSDRLGHKIAHTQFGEDYRIDGYTSSQ